MIPRWAKYVSHDLIQAHIEQGWIPMVPNAVMHHHEYGIEMGWYQDRDPPKFVEPRSRNSITTEDA